MIKFKEMQRPNWGITSKEYSTKSSLYLNGITSLTKIHSIHPELESNLLSTNEKIKILADNYYFLQIASIDENYWITAFFNEKQELLQIFIDIVDSTSFQEIDNPGMMDMYLDIIVEKTNYYYIIGQEELDFALEERMITLGQYNTAMNTKKKILDILENNIDSFIEAMKKELNYMIQ